VKDIVHAYREAAMGLAAAHDAGLVHRDFKPENAMIGVDKRVRVLDFGLVHDGGVAGNIAGTPRYMAPEQKVLDATLTAAVDQYAIGVSLQEALDAPPKWLAAIIARATADDPAARFPSMHALVAALGNDPARIRRRRIAIAGALGLAGATFAIGLRAASGDSAERCAGGADDIAGAWNPTTAENMRAHLLALGPYGAQLAELAAPELEGYATRWVATQKAACHANDRGELTPALYTSQLACLTRAKVSLATAGEVLSTATRDRLPDARTALRSLPAVERCRTDTTPPPPAVIAERVSAVDNDIARARVLAFAIDPRAIEVSAAAQKAAEGVGYARQIGQASLVHGVALVFQQQRAEAIGVLDHAAQTALEGDDDVTAIEAIARAIFVISQTEKDPQISSFALAGPIAKGLDERGAFARALYYNNLGVLENARQDRDAARRWFREAERVRPPPSRDNFELAVISANLALVEPDRAARDAYFEREIAETEAALGASHPFTLNARMKAAMYIENPTRSREMLREIASRYREIHPHLVERIGRTSYQVLWLAEEAGDLDAARAALAEIGDNDPAVSPLASGYRLLLAGNYRETLSTMAEVATKLGAGDFWDRSRSVDANILAALAAHHLRDRAAEARHAEAALATIDSLDAIIAQTYIQRRRGRVLAMLAMLGVGDVAARKKAALDWARLAGGY
jgi:tetratricopeptide (TPR) repeat protein